MDNELIGKIEKEFNDFITKNIELFEKILIEKEDMIELKEHENYNEIDSIRYSIITNNDNKALQRLVHLKNRLLKSKTLSLNEYMDEQLADQMADNWDTFDIDFYIGLK